MTASNLRRFECLGELADEQLERIAAVSRRCEFKARDRVFEENAAAHTVYFLDRGRVAIQVALGNGRQIVVETVAPGGCFGWGALVDPYRYTAAAVCVENSAVIAVDGIALLSLMEANAHLGFVLMKSVARIAAYRLLDTRIQLIGVTQG